MSYDIIIIGSGLGGLTAGAMLAKKGKKVLVLESHNIVGGCATTYQRKNMTFEVGLHEMDFGKYQLDMKHIIFKKLELLKHIELVKIPQFFRLKTETREYIIPEGYKNAKEELIKKFPHEKSGIKKYFRKLLMTSIATRRLPFDLSFLDFFFYPITTLPFQIRNILFQKSVGDTLDSIIKDDNLKRLLNTNLAYYHDDPYQFSWFYHSVAQSSYYNKAYYIKGGSQKLSDTLAKIITDNGGDVKVLSEVTRINVENGKAKSVTWHDLMWNKEYTESSDIVIANCAPDIVYKQLLPSGYEDKRLEKLKNSCSLYTVYISFKKKFNTLYPNNTYSTFITEDDKFNNSFKNMSKDESGFPVEKRRFVFVDYSTIDSGLVKEGDERSFGVITGVSYLKEWEGLEKEDYKAKKEVLARTLFERLEKHYPGFTENIEYYELSTPKTIKRFINTPDGTAYGYKQNAFLKGSRLARVSPTVKNIHFASAWGFPGGGFTGALISGYSAANNILFPTKWYVVLKTIFCIILGTLVGSAHSWLPFVLNFFKK